MARVPDFYTGAIGIPAEDGPVTVSGAAGQLGVADFLACSTATAPSDVESWAPQLVPIRDLNVTVDTQRQTAMRLARLEAKVDALRERIDERPVAYNAQIHALGDSRYSLRHPLLVTIEDYDEEVVASIPEFDLYASGVSDAVALMGLKTEIVCTYERLTELGPDRLGPLALQCLEAMKKVMEPRHG